MAGCNSASEIVTPQLETLGEQCKVLCTIQNSPTKINIFNACSSSHICIQMIKEEALDMTTPE
jgi:hypothetical protein